MNRNQAFVAGSVTVRAACEGTEGESPSIRYGRSAPCAHSGGLSFSSPTRFFLLFQLLPMSPNDCYPCPRSKDSRVMILWILNPERSLTSIAKA